MAIGTYRIDGLKELDEALRELPKATGKNVLKRALTTAAAPVEAEAKRLVPVKSGKLRDSISIGPRLSKRQRGLNTPGSPVEIFVGASALPHAHLQEFGTVKMRPRPFLRPAWDANKMKVLESIKGDLWQEIEKAAKRLAKKAAKLAAMT